MKGKRTLLFGLGLVLLLIVNGLVFYHVRSNRAANPDAIVWLTERELQPPYWRKRENSGMSLQLLWRVHNPDSRYYYSRYGSPVWLDREKLAALGFDVDGSGEREDNSYSRPSPLPRDVFVVLEAESDLHKKDISKKERELQKSRSRLAAEPDSKELEREVESREKELAREKNGLSRLYAVDAGLEATALRRQYANRQKYIITQATIRMRHTGDKEVEGTISDVLVDSLHVPLAFKRELESILGQDRRDSSGAEPPRFKAEIAYGQRFEPWLQNIEEIR